MQDINTNSFDFLRFFFAFAVVLQHVHAIIPVEQFHVFAWASLIPGVKGFYVVSGFLVSKSFANTPSLKKYFIKRIFRIVPAYTVVVLLFAIGLVFVSTLSPSEYFFSADFGKYLAANLTYLNFLHPTLPGVFETHMQKAVNGALWTIKIEEGFYLVLPVLMFIFRKYFHKRSYFFLIVYVFSLIYLNIFDYLGNAVFSRQLPGAFVYFSTGIFIYYNFERFLNYKHKIAVVALVFFAVEYAFTRHLGYHFTFIAPFAFGILVLYAAYSFKFMNRFGKYGDFTYGLYIFHFPILQLSVYFDIYHKIPAVPALIFVILLCFTASILSWFIIEKRFISRYRNRKISAQA